MGILWRHVDHQKPVPNYDTLALGAKQAYAQLPYVGILGRGLHGCPIFDQQFVGAAEDGGAKDPASRQEYAQGRG